MNKEDLGKYFIKDDVVYEAIGYTDNPTMELINRETGNRLSVVIGSDYANEFELVQEDKKIAKIGKLNQVSDSKQHLNNYILRNKINEIIDRINMED